MAYLSKFMKHCDHRKKLRGSAMLVLRTFKTPNELNKALSWLDKSIQIKKTVKNTYTKALILYTLGKYSEAHQVAEGSLALAKKQNFNVKRVEKLIDKKSRNTNEGVGGSDSLHCLEKDLIKGGLSRLYLISSNSCAHVFAILILPPIQYSAQALENICLEEDRWANNTSTMLRLHKQDVSPETVENYFL